MQTEGQQALSVCSASQVPCGRGSTWLVLLEPLRLTSQIRSFIITSGTGGGARLQNRDWVQGHMPNPAGRAPQSQCHCICHGDMAGPACDDVLPPQACSVTDPKTLTLGDSPWGASVEGPEQGRDEASFTERVAVGGRMAGRLASSGMKLTADVEGKAVSCCGLGEPWACRVLGNGEIESPLGCLCRPLGPRPRHPIFESLLAA